MYLGFTDRFHQEKVRQFTAARGQRPRGRRGPALVAPIRPDPPRRPPSGGAGQGGTGKLSDGHRCSTQPDRSGR